MAVLDSLNPIFVRALRQGLRSKGFVVSFMGLMAIGMIICAQAPVAASGAPIAGGLLSLLWFLCCFVVPTLVGWQTITSERSRDEELVRITNLSAWQLVLGRFFFTLIVLLLFLSALGPFTAASYLLGGVRLDFLIPGMLLSPFAGAFLSTVVLAITMGENPTATRRIFFLLFAAGCFTLSAPIMTVYSMGVFTGMSFTRLDIVLAAFSTALGVCMLFSARSRVLPRHLDRTSAARMVWFLLLAASVVCVCALKKGSAPVGGTLGYVSTPLLAGGVKFGGVVSLQVILIGLCGLGAVAGDLTCSPYLLRKKRRSSILFLFFGPGAGRSVAYTALLSAALLFEILFWSPGFRAAKSFFYKEMWVPFLLYVYLLFYIGVPTLALDLINPRARPEVRWLVIGVFLLLSILTAAGLALAAGITSKLSPVWAFNPFVSLAAELSYADKASLMKVIGPMGLAGAVSLALITILSFVKERKLLQQHERGYGL